MDHKLLGITSARINGVWGAPSGNYSLRPTHYSLSQAGPGVPPAETTPYALRPTPSLSQLTTRNSSP